MKATTQLRIEHDAILIILAVTDKIKEQLLQNKAINTEHVELIIDFLKTFADKCHHSKEEKYLFPALEKAGIPNERGPIGVMLYEHTLGRTFIQGMADSLSDYKNNEKNSAELLVKNMAGYIKLLTGHIQKENTILFMLAEQRLSESQQEALFLEFEKIEEEEIGTGKHEEYHKMIKQLKAEYGV